MNLRYKNSNHRFTNLIHIICLLSGISILLTACWRSRELRYYENEENYKTESIVIRSIEIAPKNDDSIGLARRGNTYLNGEFRLPCPSTEILQKNGFFDAAALGDTIEVTYAPMVWGDGYFIPIAAIAMDGITYLDFTVGKENVLEYIDQYEADFFIWHFGD